MLKAVVFDYDGVIVDSFPTVFNVYKIMCSELDIECPKTINKFRQVYGYTKKTAYENLGISPEDYEKADSIFKKEVVKQKPKLFPGIRSVLEKLSKDYLLILATSNFESEAIQKLKRFRLEKYFPYVIGNKSSGIFRKRETTLELLKKLKIRKSETVFLGDRDVDYDVAKRLGISNILMVEYGWGYSNKKEVLKGQKHLIRKPVDILKAIKRVEKKNRPYAVVPYDPGWVVKFENEKKILADIFKNKALGIEHIGSTSVPGAWAKPQIDILVTVKNLDVVNDVITKKMEKKGYTYEPNFFTTHEEKYFARDAASGERTVSVHILPEGDPQAIDHVNFRDYLRIHPEERNLYSKTKRKAYESGANRIEYPERKKEVLVELLKKSKEWAKRNKSAR